MKPYIDFICPMDGARLLREGGSLRCGQGHTFDFAKEGYCNLLLVQQKATANPGDNKEMVAARTRFLDSGHYLPVAQKVKEWVAELAAEGTLRLVDAGCGEGYYLSQLRELGVEAVGIDISKWAVRAAAKREPRASWVVASNRQLPLAPGSCELVLSLFGFPVWESFRQVLAPGGQVLLVDPGPDHLRELREVIYPVVKETGAPPLPESGWVTVREEGLRFRLNLASPSEIQDLLAMTPHAYRLSADGAARLAKLGQLETSVDLLFRLVSPLPV
jgi:23S rRNA (guanine745-N1)-methyltransferase